MRRIPLLGFLPCSFSELFSNSTCPVLEMNEIEMAYGHDSFWRPETLTQVVNLILEPERTITTIGSKTEAKQWILLH